MKTKIFRLHEVATVSIGNKLDLKEMTLENPKVNFVSRTEQNNGVACVVDEIATIKPFEKGAITVALGGSIGAAFCQIEPFYTAQNVAVLQFKEPISIYAKLYLCQVIKFEAKERFRAFGRELNKHINRDFSVRLPVKDDGNVDWLTMEKYITSLHYKLTNSAKSKKLIELDIENWKKYKLSELFNISAGKYRYSDEYEAGTTPYLSATNLDNGIQKMINLKPDFKGNCLVIGKVGCNAFYEPEDFCATSDVNILTPKNFALNSKIGLFLVTVINKNENYKWNYGRQCRINDAKEICIKLPTKNNNLDWKFMEQYVDSLMFSEKI